MMQVAIENVNGRLTSDQKDCLTFLIKINRVSEIFFYRDGNSFRCPLRRFSPRKGAYFICLLVETSTRYSISVRISATSLAAFMFLSLCSTA